MSDPQKRDKSILDACKRIAAKQVSWRRHLHQHPEIAYEETATTAYLKKVTKTFGLKNLPLDTKTGLLAELRFRGSGPTVAIRTDIDALPVNEQTGLPFKSLTPGRMHACGHDMHMATVLGVAAVLSEMKSDLAGSVRFIFQPAEEQPPGGALDMIRNKALDKVSVIFGLHVDPTFPSGSIAIRDGVSMASVTDFDIVIIGQGGHAARPHDTVDAVAVAAEVVSSLQKVISRETDPIAPAALSIGRIAGGKVRNVVADRVILNGTARALDPKTAGRLPKLIRRTTDGVCRARGAKYELTIVADYPVLVNDNRVNVIFRRNFSHLYGASKVKEHNWTLGGEDFARYLQKVPGAMFRLGTGNKKIKADKPWHHPQFIVDEAALQPGTALLVASVIDFLENRFGG